jgi:hypothetical protein
MCEFVVVRCGVDLRATRSVSHAPLVRREEHQVHTGKLLLIHVPRGGGIEEPVGVALDLKELGQGFLDHRVGAEDSYDGGPRRLSHPLAVAP